jgi:transposase
MHRTPISLPGARPCFIGIDVAKDSFQVAICPGSDNLSFAYDAAGIKALLQWLAERTVELIVLEATGGYQRRLVAALAAAGHRLVVANPRQVRAFARAKGILAKSDPLDARVIADFAATIRPQVRPLPAAHQQRLTDLATRRRQLLTIRTQEQNRLGQSAEPDLRQSLQRFLRQLDKEIQKIEALLEKTVEACPDFAAKVAQLDTNKAVGRTSAIALLAALPELGTLSRRQIVALAGLAPFNADSGQFRGSRSIWGGRAPARCVLYMIALTAIRCQADIRSFYQTLLQRGKKKKVALTAVMRRLLVRFNARLRDALHLQTVPPKIA